MQVTLIRYTPDPERVIAAAARLCYSQISATQILDNMTPSQVNRLLRRVYSSGHHSTLEHVSFTFAIDGLSRAASHQLVRHRIASYSQQSQRWVTFQEADYVTPPTVARDSGLKEEFDKTILAAFEAYRRLREAGIPAEDARYLLPNAITTRLVMTMNARELVHVCSIRLCTRAQWEIRQLFEKVKEEVTRVAPTIGRWLEIKCITMGYCDEEECCGIRPPKEEVLSVHQETG